MKSIFIIVTLVNVSGKEKNMNCFLNITVVDDEVNQDKGAPVVLTTINCDGVKRFWNADDIEEFHRWWWEE